MAQFLRGKQAGLQHDLSAGLAPELFSLDHVARYGINSQISALSYDPIQSLLAVGTNESPFGGGKIYIFGKKRVCVELETPRRASVKSLHFRAEKLISLDSKNEISIFSLETRRLLTLYCPPNAVTALVTDLTLDFAILGLQSGDVIAYDLDRRNLAPFRISNLWKERHPSSKLVSVVTLALHPRDIGLLLIGYTEGAVIYSFKHNKALNFFQYDLQPGAPGGNSDPKPTGKLRIPHLTQATWHPAGTFILTGHEDSSLVVWDSKSGKLIMARTLQNVNVDKPGSVSSSFGTTPGSSARNAPILRLAWCSKQNPDDTGILVAGGCPMNLPDQGLTFLDLGLTPTYSTSSWQVLSMHFERPKGQHTLHTPPNAAVVDFCIIPRSSPHYLEAHDPVAIITLTGYGEIATLSFPSGYPITPTNQLHVSLTFVHPFVNRMALACVDRIRWLGMTEKRSQGPLILRGGNQATRPLKRYENRNIIQTAHADGVIRIWDAGHGDEIENDNALQVDMAQALGRDDCIEISQMSMSSATGELGVGMQTGEVAIFRWDRNRNAGQDLPHTKNQAFGLESIVDRADASLGEGLIPLTVLTQKCTPVKALRVSDVGFVAAGFEDGSITVLDLREPAAVIYDECLHDLALAGKRSNLRRHDSVRGQARAEWSTVITFSVMSLEGDDYSSIVFFLGTNLGRFLTFKLLPGSRGGYSVEFAGSTNLDDRIISIIPVNANNGKAAYASQSAVASLRGGSKVDGVVVVVTQAGVRVFKPACAKGASKSFNDCLCDSATVVWCEDKGCALTALFGDGFIKTFSIPGLKQIATAKVDHIFDVRRFDEAVITPTGDIFGWTGPSAIAAVNVWGSGQDMTKSVDDLFNPLISIPSRPTISNIQWISGTQYVTSSDMDILIGGPDRPPSKRTVEQLRLEGEERRDTPRTHLQPSTDQSEGYWAYLQRQVQERTDRLNIMGDSMNKLEETSSAWTDDVSKFVNTQKKKAVMGSM